MKKICSHPFLVITQWHGAFLELRCMNRACSHMHENVLRSVLPETAVGTVYSYDRIIDLHPIGTKIMSFFVVGDPGPQGSKRHVGNHIMIEQSQKVKPWREAVALKAREAAHTEGWTLIEEGALFVDLCFWMRAPKSTQRIFHTTKPDRDKLERSTHDALMMAGCIIKDDSQIVGRHVYKHYALPNMMIGAYITLIALGEK